MSIVRLPGGYLDVGEVPRAELEVEVALCRKIKRLLELTAVPRLHGGCRGEGEVVVILVYVARVDRPAVLYRAHGLPRAAVIGVEIKHLPQGDVGIAGIYRQDAVLMLIERRLGQHGAARRIKMRLGDDF